MTSDENKEYPGVASFKDFLHAILHSRNKIQHFHDQTALFKFL